MNAMYASRSRHRAGALRLVLLLLTRLLVAAFLVFATYNPTGRSFWHWLMSDGPLPEWKLVAGTLLLVAYGIVIPIVLRALGLGGVALTTCLTTTTIWLLMEAGLLAIPAPDGATWVGLGVLSVVLGVGLCWMTIGRVLDGQLRTLDLSRG